MRYVLLGGTGILGSGYRARLARRGAEVMVLSPPWASPGRVPDAIRSRLGPALRRGRPTTVLWAAGVGHVGASGGDFSAETAGIAAVADALRDLPANDAAAITIVFASSAGALFAGAGSDLVDDARPPSPIAPYGHEKLRQEDLLRHAAEDSGARVLSCRISNLYGLAEGRLSPRGLVSTAVRCSRLRHPMTVFVSPDTRRDYLFSDDAAEFALRLGERAPPGFSTALLCEGRTRTVADVLALVGAVSRRRVPAVYAERPETRLQPRMLRFAASRRLPSGVRLTPMEVGIARMAMAPLAS